MISWRQIHWPRPLSMAGSVGLLTRLASDDRRGAVVWEARAEAGRVRYLLGAETADVLEIESLLAPLIPGVVVTDLKRPRSEVARCGRVQIRQRSLALALDGSEQMVTALLAALASATATDDVLVVQVVLGAALAPEIITAATEDPTMPLWRKLFYGPQPASAEVRSRMRGKCDQFRFRAVVRIGASADTPLRRHLLVSRVLAAFCQLQSGGTRVRLVPDRPDAIDNASAPLWLPLRLTPAEALAFAAWPQGEAELPGLPAAHPKPVPPPACYHPPAERVFATSTAPGTSQPIGIAIGDACRHTHILGPTGTGKSTLLLHLIKADLAAGRSVVLIDPKRDLAMDALALMPPQRQGDVVVIDPALPHPVGINPLATTPERRPLVAQPVGPVPGAVSLSVRAAYLGRAARFAANPDARARCHHRPAAPAVDRSRIPAVVDPANHRPGGVGIILGTVGGPEPGPAGTGHWAGHVPAAPVRAASRAAGGS